VALVGKLEVIDKLLALGADINARSQDVNRPFYTALPNAGTYSTAHRQ
jgi:hypothetical protein